MRLSASRPRAAWARASASAASIAPDAHQPLEDLVAHADHRGGLGQPIGDRRLVGIGEDGATLAQALAPAGEEGSLQSWFEPPLRKAQSLAWASHTT